MFQMFQKYVDEFAAARRHSWCVIGFGACCKCVFHMFQMFQSDVARVSCECCKSRSECFNVVTCCRCVFKCCRRYFQKNVADVICECCVIFLHVARNMT
jgi:hypothetical protein